jgi:ribosomal protein S28E/S33
MTPDTDSRTRLRFDLPEGWTTVSTPWKAARDGGSFVVVNPETRFDRPTGWMIAGDIGNRVERHDDIEIAVAAPKGDAMPRQQILAMIGWTLPEMRMIFGTLPTRIVIVGAGDPMWRGGLSGQRSLYMHSARPLISENGTSTLLHELVHLITRISGRQGHKYISEGLAEFYSIELLHRTGGTTEARYQRTVAMLKRWSRNVERLPGRRSRGPVTARAVLMFMDLDKELREASDGERSLDDVTRLLMEKRRVDTDDLIEAATQVHGRLPDTLDTPLIR